MKPRPASLDQIERWMQSVITHPGGVAEGVGSPAARAHVDIGLDELESVLRPSRALDSAQRLEIYVDAYHERLLECLREEFQFTRAAVGDELFDAVAFGYLRQHPSRSYTLAALGARLPEYLAQSRLHDQARPASAGETWADFVSELATLERWQREIFDGPGSEGQAGIELDQLAAVAPQARAALRLTPCPSLRLCRFEHPVDRYWEACKRGESPSAPPAEPTRLVLVRQNYVVHRHRLEPAEMTLLELLAAGRTVGEAISGAAEASSDPASVASALGRWFARFSTQRFFVAFQLG